MAVTEAEASAALDANFEYLEAQTDVEDFGVALDDRGQVCIQILSPEELPAPRQQQIQQRFGAVPVSFGRASRGKMAY